MISSVFMQGESSNELNSYLKNFSTIIIWIFLAKWQFLGGISHSFHCIINSLLILFSTIRKKGKYYLLSTCYVPVTLLRALQASIHLEWKEIRYSNEKFTITLIFRQLNFTLLWIHSIMRKSKIPDWCIHIWPSWRSIFLLSLALFCISYLVRNVKLNM